jgi:WD40 repeat protein
MDGIGSFRSDGTFILAIIEGTTIRIAPVDPASGARLGDGLLLNELPSTTYAVDDTLERLVVLVKAGPLLITTAADGTPISRPLDAPPDLVASAIDLSADGSRFAAVGVEGGKPRLVVLDTATGKRAGTLPTFTEQLTSVALHPDGKRVLVGTATGRIETVDLATGKRADPLAVGVAPITQLLVTSDGARVLALSGGATRQLDLRSGRAVGGPLPVGAVDRMAFSADRTSVLMSGTTGLMRWSVTPADWADRGCRAAGRNLTKAEWARYLPADEPYRKTCPAFAAGA